MKKLILLASILSLTFGAAPNAFGQWQQTPLNAPNANCFAVIGTNLFAGTNEGVYLTTNNGTSWASASFGLPAQTYIHALTVSGTNLFAVANGVYLSTNNGRTWAAINHGMGTDSAAIASLAVSGTNLFAGCSNDGQAGVFRSTDSGKNWTSSSTGLTNVCVSALAASGPNIIAGTTCGADLVWLSSNSGANWIAESGSPSSVGTFAVDGANIFAGNSYQDGAVFHSADNGMNWAAAGVGVKGFVVYSIAIDSANVFAGASPNGSNTGGVFLSTNNGSSWNPANTGFGSGSTFAEVSALAVVGTNLFAGVSNNGANLEVWRRPLSDFGFTAPTITPSEVTLNFGTHTFGSDSTLTVMLHNTSTTPVGIDTEEFTGSDSIDFTITSNTKQATLPYELQLGDSIGFTITYTAPSNPENDTAMFQLPFAETPGTAVQVTLIGSSKPLAGVAETTSTSLDIQSYPNPFSQSTQISFTSVSAGFADVSVVNLLGAEVVRLFSGELSSGEHSFEWDAVGEPAGMYECVVRMGGNVQHIPLSVVR